MEFFWKQEQSEQEHPGASTTFLVTNGLGGYCSLSADGGVYRCDQGLLISALRAPDLRITLVHGLKDRLITEKACYVLSSRSIEDQKPEAGSLPDFTLNPLPVWQGELGGISVCKCCAIAREENTAAVSYKIRNRTDRSCCLTLEPFVKFAPKEQAREKVCDLSLSHQVISGDGYRIFIKTDGTVSAQPARWERFSYPEDQKDGRPGSGLGGCCCRISFEIPAGKEKVCSAVFSAQKTELTAEEIFRDQQKHLGEMVEKCGLQDPVARQLAMAADAYISRRDSTGGKTILAGYPLFSDWGRDTMIALRGCCLSAGRFAEAKEILKTFLLYERRGLMPNLFPEGGSEPLYNTVDAALLFIDSVWQYYKRTKDFSVVEEAFPAMKRIIECYCMGTDHGIQMDGDGLIMAGQGFDQVTWMDVRIGDILPTPRHGKPVEINAYWYNGLKIMENLAPKMGETPEGYRKLAELVKKSFLQKFFLPEKGYLKDVLSNTQADEQIRCNQIWAVSADFSMLSHTQARQVVHTVKEHLFTDHGLRSLSPQDPQYHPHYGGDQLQRDLAYHQGTVWVFPLGAFYLSWLKVAEDPKEAAAQVRLWLSSVKDMLAEGCMGQLPEIYDGDHPREGKGCFAQAWSVGELLTVYEALEDIERKP